MGIKRSLHNGPTTPFLVESFVWAMTKPFESWYIQRKRYADRATTTEVIRQAIGQHNRPLTSRNTQHNTQ
jgi:hypothetical protein